MKITLKQSEKSEYLVHDEEYTVYAVYFYTSKIEFMIMVDAFPSAPHAVDAGDVDIKDNRLSKYWVFGVTSSFQKTGVAQILSFPEWANDKYFYQKLIEGGEVENVLTKYSENLELEFAGSNITLEVIQLGEGWVQCAECDDAWLLLTNGEVVMCPECNAKQLLVQN